MDTITIIDLMDHTATPVSLRVYIQQFYMTPDGTRIEIETSKNYFEFLDVRGLQVRERRRIFDARWQDKLVRVDVKYAA